MASLSDLPVELILDHLLPIIPVRDLLSLTCTNRMFAQICNDETFWRKRLQSDFNFSTQSTARVSGWKIIYRGLNRPEVYTWGENSHSRLGSGDYDGKSSVPTPHPVFIPGTRIVDLVAGGMSFHALDSAGHVYVWGTLDGLDSALRSEGFSQPGLAATTPTRLVLPAPTKSISCGRLHATTLDDTHTVYTFTSWGRPFRFKTRLLSCASPQTTPVQVSSGWGCSAVLTRSGDVLVWFPRAGFGQATGLSAAVQEANSRMDNERDKSPMLISGSHDEPPRIPCHVWEIEYDPIKLNPLPDDLPHLDVVTAAGGEKQEEEPVKLIKIAAMENNMVGLTNHGHVLLYDDLGGESSVSSGRWKYLPYFSELEKVKEHFIFDPTKSGETIAPPNAIRITHISAQFRTFIAYSPSAITSDSVVLMGSADITTTAMPEIIPSLQYRDVISVVLGDYHYGALTAQGGLFTWGAYSHGALGLGDPVDIPAGQPGGYQTEEMRNRVRSGTRRPIPPRVEVPSQVVFAKKKALVTSQGDDATTYVPKQSLCYLAAAAGWHMGALVIDLEPNEEDFPLTKAPNTNGVTSPGPTSDPVSLPSQEPQSWGFPRRLGLGGASIFRVGFAGRGRGRGGSGPGT